MQNEDGGWGIHIEVRSTVFGSCLSYICLRLLGQGGAKDHLEEGGGGGMAMVLARGHKWIRDHGGAVGIPSWGKFWLAVTHIPSSSFMEVCSGNNVFLAYIDD